MPLANKRILITRSRHQASELATQLEALGATPILIPAIEIIPPASFSALDAALTCLSTYDWLVLTSANAVEAFHRRAQFQHLTQLPKKIAVIGPATARAANAIGLTVDLIPPRYISESLAEALLPEATGKSFLIVRAAEARDILPESLTAAGATVTVVEAYRNQIPSRFGLSSAIALQRTNELSRRHYLHQCRQQHGISFASSTLPTWSLPSQISLASIGPITSQALRELGHEPTVEAAEPTIPALIQAIAAL